MLGAWLAPFAALLLLFLAPRPTYGAEPAVISVPPRASPPPASPKLRPEVDVSRFVGKPITQIEVSLDDETWRLPEVPKVTSVRPGQLMTGQAARRAMEDVLESGMFARARVAAVADGAGVKMVVHVVQRRLVELLRLDLHGAPLEREELLREADLLEGGEILGTDIDAYQERLLRYLARRGYPTAAVTITTRDTDDPARVMVIVDIAPGGPRVLQRRVFYVLGADARTLHSELEDYRVSVGDRCDENAFDAADAAMAARLRSLGYQRAELSHDLVFADNLVTLRVRVAAGARSEPRFEGNEHYDKDTLKGALGLDEESDLSPSHLVQKIRDFYVKRGFLDVEVNLETRGSETNGVRLLVFHITENDRVKVRTREYPCVKLDEIRGLSGGGPSSPSEIGGQIDSFLDEELPGADLFRDPDPKGLDETISHGERRRHGTRAEPLDLQPDSTFAPDTYDRAVLHVQELYRNEGFLHAEVGPVRVLRRACAKHSPVGRCIPVAFSAPPPDECAYDAANLPVAVAPLDPSYTCRPDPARGIECEPELTLRIPVKLGPRTMLDDVQFSGVHAVTEAELGRATELVLGDPVNAVKLEDARRKILDVLKEEGYFFADAKYTIDPSADHTRARVRFDVVEGEQVIVKQILVHGNTRTNDSTIRPRIALEVGKPYRTSDVRKTRERIATLNVFSTINVGLEDPYVPQRDKVVIIDLVERKPQAVDYSVGLSTGEGIRGEIDYTNANIGGDAVSLGARVRLSYLPDELIFDQTVRNNFDTLSKGFSDKRLAYRITGTIGFPEVGLGPLARAQIDGVAVNDLEHDFRLTKYAGIPALYYRPFHELQFALSQSVEHNEVNIFQYKSIADYLAGQGVANAIDLQTLLRFPDGPSHAFAQRFVVTWDRRDDPFNPRHGTFFVSGFEHTDWYQEPYACGSACPTITSGHTLRFTETIAGYIPVTKTITFAAELRAGLNVQLNPGSQTYPDRLFFLGGAQSMRGYLQDSLVPQDVADHIAATANSPNPYTVNQVALRGGNLMVNPKFELRIPIHPPFSTVAFVDAGNVWQDATYVLSHGFPLRTTAGSGVRVDSPIGALAFDYGVNLSRLASSTRNYEDFGEFHFAIGLF